MAYIGSRFFLFARFGLLFTTSFIAINLLVGMNYPLAEIKLLTENSPKKVETPPENPHEISSLIVKNLRHK